MCSEGQEATDDGRQDLSSTVLSGLLFVRGELPQHERGGATSAQFSDAVQTYPPRCPCPEECEEDGCIGHCLRSRPKAQTEIIFVNDFGAKLRLSH